MDPVAHTLAGACMAQTGLKKTTPLATATLLIGANLPDVDVVFQFVNMDTGLLHRRGWTHGVLAMLLLPVLLAWLVVMFDRLVRRRQYPEAPPVNLKAILALSYLGVLSHPFLDWLNTYGVRLLMPFSGTWFYGDTLFIIDPWLWLLMGAAVVFAYSGNWFSKSAWVALGSLMTVLITMHPDVPTAAKFVWGAGLIVIFGLRLRGLTPTGTQRTAFVCFAAFFIYLAALGAGNSHARHIVTEKISTGSPGSGNIVVDLMAGPLPANPFQRMVVVKTESHYHGFNVGLIGSRIEPIYEPVPLPFENPVIAAARRKDEIKGFVNWMRFPVYSVEEKTDGFFVTIRDLRYVTPDATESAGIGMAQVMVYPGDIGN